jgi:hypothetical protein
VGAPGSVALTPWFRSGYVVGRALRGGTIVVSGMRFSYRTASRRVTTYREFFAPESHVLFRPWLWTDRSQGRLGAPRINFAEMTLFIPGRDSHPEARPIAPTVP